MSPTQRSLAYLRRCGYVATVTERWNPHAGIRQDLFGIVDVLAVRKGETLGVQCTSAPNVSSRVTKMLESDVAPVLIDAGWRLEVHGWAKGKRGDPRIVELGRGEAVEKAAQPMPEVPF